MVPGFILYLHRKFYTTMKPNKLTTQVKAARRGSRQAEIDLYGHPLPHHKVHTSKKTYSRAKAKAGLKKDRPFDFPPVAVVASTARVA
jgi:hypothetical protein